MSERERPGCYQCDGEDLEEVQARRKAEIRAFAAAQIAEADAALTGVPLTNTFEDVFHTQEIPHEQETPEVVNEHDVHPNSDADLSVDATAMSAEGHGSPATADAVAEHEADKPKRKAPRKATDPA